MADKNKSIVPSLLREGAKTYEERNKVYGDNYKNVGNVMKAMFPDGIKLETAEDFTRWHLLELKIVKLTRYANNFLTGGHLDSIHDDGVYSFMLEAIDKELNNG
jgi:hypothetical protein